MSYVLEEIGADGARESVAIFSGGSLLFGATGRPDLLGPDHTQALVHHQHDSVHRIAADLPDHAHVLPTHGFGSFCSAGSTEGATASTIGEERVKNPALTLAAEQWIAETLAGLEAWPAYYAHMGPANLLGPGTPDLTQPTPADRESLARSLAAGEWVVDLRDRKAFAGSHVVGTLNFGGDDAQFSTYLGWLFPWGTPLTLVGESAEQVAAAQRELVRIGIDQLAGSATGEPADWTAEELGSFPTGTFGDLEHVRHHREVVVLDVRRPLEYDESHIAGAVNMVTARPTGEFGGSVKLTGGDLGRIDGELTVNFPTLGNSLNGKLALITRKRDGIGESLWNGREYDDVDRQAARTV